MAGRSFDYPTRTNSETACVTPAGDTGNSANCGNALFDSTVVSAYGAPASPFGTFDQGGNHSEFNETLRVGSFHKLRGGNWNQAGLFSLHVRSDADITSGNAPSGFRVASIPEPGTGLLLGLALGGLAGMRRRRVTSR